MPSSHGTKAEDILQQVCSCIFGNELVFRSPFVAEESGRKELTDILVLFDDIAIIIHSKSVVIQASDIDDIKLGRIKKKHQKAMQQFSTTLNAYSRNADVYAKMQNGHDFKIIWSRIKYKIGLISLNIPDSMHENPEFRFQYPNMLDVYRDIKIHTFILTDLCKMACELTTPADFIYYIMTREKCINEQKLIWGNELDLLALYKMRYPDIEKSLNEQCYNIFVSPGLWEDYRGIYAEKINERQERHENSIIYDKIIKIFYETLQKEFYENINESENHYLLLFGKLNKTTRMERAEIGNKLLQSLEKTKKKKCSYFIYTSKLMNISYLFLFVNENREIRQKILSYLCEQACHQITSKELIGIASNGAKQYDNVIDAKLFNVEKIKMEIKQEKNYKLFESEEKKKISEWQ